MTSNPAQGSPVPAASNRREVFVVDDMPEICEFFGGLMRRMRGLEIHLTTEVNSARALEVARARSFDLVVSDYRMRQVDGVEVLAAARERNPDGHRILMTGYNEIPTSMERIRAALVDAYIQKPLRTQELLLLLLDFLHRNPSTIEACRSHAREMELAGVREGAPQG